MRIFRGVPDQADQAVALTIGNFDGIHRGHQALLKQLVTKAHSLGLPATVLTFEPHPREYFSPASAPPRLSSLREKLEMLCTFGIDRIYLCRFNAAYAALSAEAFIDHILVKSLAVRHLYVGDDFCFGRERQGNFEQLKAAGKKKGFTVEAMPTFNVENQRASSSSVRAALAAGNLAQARDLLGRPYSISGRVIEGDKIGRTLGYPTANIQMKKRLPALRGVFAVTVDGLTDTPIQGVANIGSRPTLSTHSTPRLEVHLFDWTKTCYRTHLQIHFMHKLRDECKFDSLEALKAQITRDTQAAHTWFKLHTDL